MPLIIAVAHPTPAFRLIAPKTQFWAHAPHSIHKSLSVTKALFPFMAKTPCGQTSMHLPQPVHFSEKNWSVVTLAKYFIQAPID
jgi:hypothetical protein